MTHPAEKFFSASEAVRLAMLDLTASAAVYVQALYNEAIASGGEPAALRTITSIAHGNRSTWSGGYLTHRNVEEQALREAAMSLLDRKLAAFASKLEREAA